MQTSVFWDSLADDANLSEGGVGCYCPQRWYLSTKVHGITLEKTFNAVQWRTQEFCSGGVQQIQLRTDDREDEDLGAVAP